MGCSILANEYKAWMSTRSCGCFRAGHVDAESELAYSEPCLYTM